MAHVTRFYISQILKELCGKFSGISEWVYPGHRPSGTEALKKEMIVVSVPLKVDDQNAWQKSVLRVELIVRNRSNGIEPTDRLDEMGNEVAEMFPIAEKRYQATNPKVVMTKEDGIGFTIRTMQATLTVNTTDSYEYENTKQKVKQ